MVEKKELPPKEIEVGPYVYSILCGDAPSRTQLGGDCGETDSSELVIRINGDRVSGVRRETTLHEVLHALTDMAGLVEQYGTKTDEQWCRRVTPLLLDTLRRNPKLCAFLLSDG